MLQAAYPITARIGGQASEIASAGLTPDTIGVFQVTLLVPSFGSGTYDLQILVSDITSTPRLISISGIP